MALMPGHYCSNNHNMTSLWLYLSVVYSDASQLVRNQIAVPLLVCIFFIIRASCLHKNIQFQNNF